MPSLKWIILFIIIYTIYVAIDLYLHDGYKPNFFMWGVIAALVADKALEER